MSFGARALAAVGPVRRRIDRDASRLESGGPYRRLRDRIERPEFEYLHRCFVAA